MLWMATSIADYNMLVGASMFLSKHNILKS